MSKEPPKPNPDKPPRVKLTKGNGNGDQPEIPDSEKLPAPGENAPPPIKLPQITSKEATSPVDISPTEVSRSKDETTGIELGTSAPTGLQDQTIKIHLPDDALAAGQAGTSRVEMSGIKPASSSNFDPFDSNQTMRIDLSAGGAKDSKSDTSAVEAPPAATPGSEENAAAQTMRVDLEGTEDLTAAIGGQTIPIKGGKSEMPPTGELDPIDQTMQIKLEATGNLNPAASEAQPPAPGKETSKVVPPAETAPFDPTDQTMKIKLEATGNLNPAASGAQPPAPAKESPADDAPMQTMRIQPEDKGLPPAPHEPSQADPYQQTVRVDLHGTGAEKTAPIDPSMQTMRVDLSEGEGLDEQAPPISPADASMQTMRIDIQEGIPSEKKRDTSRLSLGATQSIKEATSELQDQEAKSKSGTIPLGDEGELHKLVENQDSLTEQTIKLELENKKAGKTSPISTAPIPPLSASSVDLEEVMSSEPGKAPKAGSPKTIRMRKPDAPPTRVLKKSPAPEQTIRVQGADTVVEDAKTGTARIDLPGEDSGDKKTIRIRRPGAAPVGTATISVSRRTSTSMGRKPVTQAASLGWGYTLVAVCTAILVGVTIYVLAAQLNSIPTDGQSLPWPGRVL